MADENDPDSNNDRENVPENEIENNVGVSEDSELDSLVEEAAQEYVALDTTLDQIDSFLNVLEQKNDDLFSQARELLESSRQTRLELQQVNEKNLPANEEKPSKEDS